MRPAADRFQALQWADGDSYAYGRVARNDRAGFRIAGRTGRGTVAADLTRAGTLAIYRHGRLVLDLWWGPGTMPNELLPVFVCELSERVEITSYGHAFPYFWVPGFDSVWPPNGVRDAQPVPAHLGTPVGFSLHHVEVAGIEPA